MFCELADCYVQAINSDAVPTISTAWERVIDGEISRVYDHALQELNKYVQEVIMKKFPMENEELKQQLRTVRTKTLATLNSLTI